MFDKQWSIWHWTFVPNNWISTMQALEPRGHMGQTVKFETPLEQRIFLEDIQSEHFMQRQFGEHLKAFSYDTEKFDWDGTIRKLLVEKGIVPRQTIENLASLSNLHTVLSDDWKRLDDSELNKVSKAFYDNDVNFDTTYRHFIRDVVARHCGEPVWWQRTPTMRFHFPNQQGFTWKPRYHVDIMLGHPPQEVNVWLPLTNTYGTNSMCIAPLESSYDVLRGLNFDFEDFATKVQYDDTLADRCGQAARPLELKYGEYLMFDPRCIHATQDNRTQHTRISIDLRVLPQSQRDRMRIEYRGTGRRRMLFAPGHYYDERLSTAI